MDTPVGLVPQDAVDKRAVSLIELTQLNQDLSNLLWRVIEKRLGERRCPLVSPRVLHAQLVKHLLDRCGRPDVHLHASFFLQETA